MITPLDFVPQAAQGFIQIVAPVDPSVVIVTVDGVQGLFELDNNGSVESGRILVPIGGSPAACATNLAVAINLHWGDRVRAHVEGTFIDVIAHMPRTHLNVSIVGSGSVARLIHDAQRLLPTGVVMVKRDVFAEDATRGKIVVHVRLDYIQQVMVEFLAPGTGGWHLDWTGTIGTAPGKIELVNGGGNPFATGHWMQLLAIGDRYEQ